MAKSTRQTTWAQTLDLLLSKLPPRGEAILVGADSTSARFGTQFVSYDFFLSEVKGTDWHSWSFCTLIRALDCFVESLNRNIRAQWALLTALRFLKKTLPEAQPTQELSLQLISFGCKFGDGVLAWVKIEIGWCGRLMERCNIKSSCRS